MATLIPDFNTIMKFKVKPEPGELCLLQFLERTLDDSYEVYFNPYMNGDRPDVVIMRKGNGVFIIEVKDWDLDLYEFDNKKHWTLKSDSKAHPKSPISQVLKYKENLFNLHIDTLLDKKISNLKFSNIVSCAVYFHNASLDKVNAFLVNPFKADHKYMKFLNYNCELLGWDSLNEKDFQIMFEKHYLSPKQKSILFSNDLYESFKHFMNPPMHMLEEGKEFKYTEKQKDLIFFPKTKEQRIKGVVGSGKTTIMCARAVQAYKELCKTKPNPEILLLTFNITLKNYIHDKLNNVRENFDWKSFVIKNYHEFINSELANNAIKIIAPLDDSQSEDYFESAYYSNKSLFQELDRTGGLHKYDAVFIDEIQDYKRPWMDIIKTYFLVKDGEYKLFGDVKQNIYQNPTGERDVITNVKGVNTLKRCMRSDFKIKDLAVEYQKAVFNDKYEIDDFNMPTLGFEDQKLGDVKYIFLQNVDIIQTLLNIVCGNFDNKRNEKLSRNDITVLGGKIKTLRDFEAYYRFKTKEKTNPMFESIEQINKINIDRFVNASQQEKKNEVHEQIGLWIKKGIKLIGCENYKNPNYGNGVLSELFSLYHIYSKYKTDEIIARLMANLCLKNKITLSQFEDYMTNDSQYDRYVIETFERGNYEYIRKNKKINFWANRGTIKISTIHSFKGWESELVFVFIENYNNEVRVALDELIYTGFTRCRSNLVIINFGNKEFDEKLKPLVEKVK